MVVRAALDLIAIASFPHQDERLLLHHDVASLCELHRRRNLADKPQIRQVFARRRHSLDIEISFEMSLNLGRGSRFPDLAQTIEHQPEQRGRALRKVVVDRVQRRLHILARLLREPQAGARR